MRTVDKPHSTARLLEKKAIILYSMAIILFALIIFIQVTTSSITANRISTLESRQTIVEKILNNRGTVGVQSLDRLGKLEQRFDSIDSSIKNIDKNIETLMKSDIKKVKGIPK